MLTKRLIACFDVKEGMVTKAHKFQNNIDIDTAENIARRIYQDKNDEVKIYNIKTSNEKLKNELRTIKK